MSTSSLRDARVRAAILTVALIFVAGLLIAAMPRETPRAPQPPPHPHAAEVDQRFRQGVVMLHARQYEHAVTAFHQVLKYAPDMPEAHVNMGYALVGMGRHAAARDFFESATVLRPQQTNAYYGMALALEGLGDIPGAIGAMRTYVHLTSPTDRYRRKAEAALWEWESAPRR